jgi:hypothetical protein
MASAYIRTHTYICYNMCVCVLCVCERERDRQTDRSGGGSGQCVCESVWCVWVRSCIHSPFNPVFTTFRYAGLNTQRPTHIYAQKKKHPTNTAAQKKKHPTKYRGISPTSSKVGDTHTHTLIHTHTHTYTHTHTHTYTNISTHTHTHTHVCIYIHTYIYIERESERRTCWMKPTRATAEWACTGLARG